MPAEPSAVASEDESGSTPADTSSFTMHTIPTIPEGTMAPSLEELFQKVYSHAKEHGFKIVKRGPRKPTVRVNGKRSVITGAKANKMHLDCVMVGRKRKTIKDSERQRNRVSAKTGCQSSVIAYAVNRENVEGAWAIRYGTLDPSQHNHPTLDAVGPPNRRIRTRILNLGTIGTSWITDSFIASANSTKKWKLAGVCSRHLVTAQYFAAKYNDPTIQVYDSVSALVANNSIHAVYIASPNSLHYEHAKTCLLAKKHVILEKPATSSLKDYTELRALSTKQGVFLIEAFRHLYEANFNILRQCLGRLGTIQGASFTYASRSSRYNNVLAGETPNIFSLEFGGGSLVDLGVYPIAAAVALFGKPLSQSYKPTIVRTGVDGGGFINLEYEKFGVQINASKIWSSSRLVSNDLSSLFMVLTAFSVLAKSTARTGHSLFLTSTPFEALSA